MHIINAMFSRGLGGIEQSFVDYCEALKMQGHKVTAIIHPDAEVRKLLVPVGINILGVKNLGGWDIFAKSYLKKMFGQVNADAIIAHGNRAISLMIDPAKKSLLPVIGVTHNYSIKRLIGLDAVFATTDDLRKKVISAGQSENTVYNIPNMIKTGNKVKSIKEFSNPPRIGAMGRFVKKKGFDVFLRAISELNNRNIEIKAIIAGTGEEEKELKSLAKSLGLDEAVEFSGWVNNKDEFFGKIDIFCLPSAHEPFGIILLEAFMHGKSVVTTDSEGPSEIASNERDSLIVEKNSPTKMADAIEKLINDPDLAKTLAGNGLKTVEKYSMENVGVAMSDALGRIARES